MLGSKTGANFDDPVTDAAEKKYLPSYGEGDTMASQIATAVTKLIYKWRNDGDVFDNVNTGLEGWANDISSYANWLYNNVPEVSFILEAALNGLSKNDYAELLAELMWATYGNEELMAEYAERPATGSVYDSDGPFEFVDYDEDEDDFGYYAKRRAMKMALRKKADKDSILIDGYHTVETVDGVRGKAGIELIFNALEERPEFIITFDGEQAGEAYSDYASAWREFDSLNFV